MSGPLVSTYHDEFKGYDDLLYGTDNPPSESIVYAGYTYESYSGDALIVFERDGQLWENNDGHCSCNGLEDWRPEVTTVEALRMRKGWPGLEQALDSYVTVRSAK